MAVKEIKNQKSKIKTTVKKTTVVKKEVVVKKTVAVKKTVSKPIVKATKTEVHHSMSLTVYDIKGVADGRISLPEEIFGAKINNSLMAQAVRVYLANQRRGTLKTKSRGEVAISTRKIYRQKGTGRARHGAASAPIFVGGGIAFGPKPRDFSMKLNQNMRKAALFSALSAKLKDGEIKIITGLEKIEPKTKKMADVVKKLELNIKGQSLLLVTPKAGVDFDNVSKAARNINGVRVLSANQLNTYEILVNSRILFMRNAIDSLKETFLK
jgi:large subunit ribosomal protein L4